MKCSCFATVRTGEEVELVEVGMMCRLRVLVTAASIYFN